MSSQKAISLDEAIQAARDLPQEAQAALAKILMDEIEDFAVPYRSHEHQVHIRQRSQQPLKAISRNELMAMLRQYNPAL